MNFVDLPSPNQAARPDGAVVDILVLHYAELPLQESLDILRDATREIRVSSHYVLDLDGTAYRLVPEDRTAWHAGKSWWRGREALNGTSIGIEIVNLLMDIAQMPKDSRPPSFTSFGSSAEEALDILGEAATLMLEIASFIPG